MGRGVNNVVSNISWNGTTSNIGFARNATSSVQMYFYNFLMYNRCLSQKEITQNYLYNKTIFGL
jgi:hypothetical protein